MRPFGAVLAAILSLIGCNKKASFNIENAPQTEGERIAASERHPPGWVYVKALDDRGNVLGEGWEFKKPPDRFERDGLSHLRPYIDKLLASKNWFSSVTAITIDGDTGLSVWKMEGRIELHESFSAPGESEPEKVVRAICRERGFTVGEEYLTEDAHRMVSWILPHDPEVVTEMLSILAEKLHGIPKDAGMEITFEEHPDERNKHSGEGGIAFVFTYPIEDPSAPPPSN